MLNACAGVGASIALMRSGSDDVGVCASEGRAQPVAAGVVCDRVLFPLYPWLIYGLPPVGADVRSHYLQANV